MKPETLPLIVATDARAAAAGAQMVLDGHAYGCLYVDDRPGGGIDVRYVVGVGHEHRMPEIDAMIARVADSMGAVAVDPALLVRGGEA